MDSSEEDTYDVINNLESDSSDDDLLNENIENSKEAAISESTYGYQFEVLTTEEVFQQMNDSINDVNGVLNLQRTTVRLLLNHFKWEKEKLLEQYYDEDLKRLFREANITDQTIIQNVSKVEPSASEQCKICYTSFVENVEMMFGLECGHRFCTECLEQYLSIQIVQEGLGQTIACPEPGCTTLFDDVTAMKLLPDSIVKTKYLHLITDSFVVYNRLLRWCPGVSCVFAIKVLCIKPRAVFCKCGHSFCFKCGEDWHEPVECDLLSKWLKKCAEDTLTANWIMINTKPCPKCKTNIEKNGGCNHMSCKNRNCLHEFCWLCKGLWEGHGQSSCNIIPVQSNQPDKSSFERYLNYFEKYKNHKQSLVFEKKLYEPMAEKMKELLLYNMSLVEVQFLKKAVDILVQCRQTLAFTNIFAYYLQENNQSLIFEDNKKDLESATETLSEFLELDITSATLNDIKRKVKDKSRYCEKRCKIFLDYVNEGYNNCWWKFSKH